MLIFKYKTPKTVPLFLGAYILIRKILYLFDQKKSDLDKQYTHGSNLLATIN